MDWTPLRIDIDPINYQTVDLYLLLKQSNIDIPDDELLLQAYARSAIEDAEGFMHRAIMRRTHRWVLNRFPCFSWDPIRLPRGKTQSIENIQYSQNGSITTLTGPSASPAGAGFQEDLAGDDGGVILAPRGQSWPSVDCDVPTPVAIQFTAGYDIGKVPPAVVHWIAFSVADAYQNRDTGSIEDATVRTRVMTSMLSPFILNRLY